MEATNSRVLNFDCETRTLGWYAGGWTQKEITAIASCWADDPEGTLQVHLLGEHTPTEMLGQFFARYHKADLVTGHHIRGFDLPLLNAAAIEAGLPALPGRMTCDTLADLTKLHGLSKSQEHLASVLGIQTPNVGMAQADWRTTRVVDDVLQHVELRRRLLDLGYLRLPKRWRP